jgi:hypothetical protein
MTRFSVPMGGGKPESKAETKKYKKRAIHPGLVRYAIGIECQACKSFLDFQFSVHREISAGSGPPIRIASCECGLWFEINNKTIRFIRFSSGPVEVGGGEIFTP